MSASRQRRSVAVAIAELQFSCRFLLSRGIARRQAAEWVQESLVRVALTAQAFSSAHRLAEESLMQLVYLDKRSTGRSGLVKVAGMGDPTVAEKVATQQVIHGCS